MKRHDKRKKTHMPVAIHHWKPGAVTIECSCGFSDGIGVWYTADQMVRATGDNKSPYTHKQWERLLVAASAFDLATGG